MNCCLDIRTEFAIIDVNQNDWMAVSLTISRSGGRLRPTYLKIPRTGKCKLCSGIKMLNSRGPNSMDKLGGGWTKRTILEPTGKAYNNYYYKRKKAHRVVIDTPKAKALGGYTLIEKDIRSGIIWLNHIHDLLKDDPNYLNADSPVKATYSREKFNIAKGLFVAALTFYGKCFATCEGRRIKLEKKNLDENFHSSHDDAIELRHNFAAHSGDAGHEYVKVVAALDSKKKSLPYVGRELFQPDTYIAKDINGFISLFEHAQIKCNEKIETLSEKLYEEDILKKGMEYWYEKI